MDKKIFMTSMTVDRIEIVQSLGPHEEETGQELFDLIEVLNKTTLMPTRRLTKVNSVDEFFYNLEVIEQKVDGGKGLILHFDIHGSSDHLGLILNNRNRDFISWDALAKSLRTINLKSNFQLNLFMSVCSGYHFCRSFSLSKPSPIWGITAPEDLLYLRDILQAVPEYYSKWATSGDGNMATEALNMNSSTEFIFSTAERIFRILIQRIFTDKKNLSRSEREAVLDRYLKEFFMLDLIPDLIKRIKITLDDFG